MESDLIIEISNKVDNNNESLKYKNTINKLTQLLDEAENVKHYMVREEVYVKKPDSWGGFYRTDGHDTLFIERKQMDNVDHYYDIINK